MAKCSDPTCQRAHLELGQMAFGNPAGEYDLPEHAQALFFRIWEEIARVFWNKNQKEFSSIYGEDPGIPGIAVNSYYWGDDPSEAAKPNFTFGDVEIRWYKYVGRGMSCNRLMTADEWVKWFDACFAAVRKKEP